MPSKQSQTTSAPPLFVAALTQSPAADLQQYKSEVPNGSVAVATPASTRLTRKSPKVHIRRGTALASHWLNPPLTEGVITVSRIYKILREMAFNYQREHQDAFFEAYPDLLISDGSDPDHTTAELRTNYRRYCKRIAHYYWLYQNEAVMLFASYVNMANMTRLNGTEAVKELATAFKWSTLNTVTNYLDRFPQPVGAMSYIIHNAAFVVGQTDYQSDFVSLPLYITDVFGARGNQSIPITTMCTQSSDSLLNKGAHFANRMAMDSDQLPAGSEGYEDKSIANKLLFNIAVAATHSSNTSFYDGDGTYSPQAKAVSPKVENSTTGIGLLAPAADRVAGTVMFHTNEHLSDVHMYGSSNSTPTGGSTDNIIGPLWDSWHYWLSQLIKHFSDMMDVNSDKYQIGVNVLKLFEPGMANDKVLSALRANKNVGVADIQRLMTYKHDNAVTTATVVKFMPFTAQAELPQRLKTLVTQSDVIYNFERYSVDDSNITRMLHQSRAWPSLTPAIFSRLREYGGETDMVPYVLNVAYEVGSQYANYADVKGSGGVKNTTDADSISAPIGKGAVLLDLASIGSLNPEFNKVTTVGVAPEFSKEWVDSSNAVCFSEEPSQIFTPQLPLIDSTDPFQCGFNILISAGDQYPSEVARILTDPSLYDDNLSEATVTHKSDCYLENTIAYKFDGAEHNHDTKHVANPEYLNKVKHTLVFLGSSILMHPLRALALPIARPPRTAVLQRVGNATEKGIVDLLKILFSSSETLPDSHVGQFISASYTPAIDKGNIASIFGRLGLDGLYKFNNANSWVGIGGLQYIEYLFDPRYPGPAPFSETITQPEYCAPIEKDSNEGDTFRTRSMTPQIGKVLIGNGTVQGTTPLPKAVVEPYGMPNVLRGGALSQSEYIPWLLQVQFKLPYVAADAVLNNTARLATDVDMAGLEKWPLLLLGDMSVEYSGAKEMINFWDNKTFESMPDSLSQSGAVPEQNIIAPPREATGSRAARTPAQRMVATQTPTWRSSSVEAVQKTGGFTNPGSGFDADKVSAKSSGSSRRFRGRRGKKNHYHDQDNTQGISEKGFGGRDSGETSSEPLGKAEFQAKSTAFTDKSSKTLDEKVKKGMSTDSDSLRTQ